MTDEHDNNPEVIVIFRKWRTKDGDIIALFPELPSDYRGDLCDSYEHVGQHGGADFYGVINRTRPAMPEEYAALRAELEDAPYRYRFTVRRKVGYRIHQKRRESARRYGLLV